MTNEVDRGTQPDRREPQPLPQPDLIDAAPKLQPWLPIVGLAVGALALAYWGVEPLPQPAPQPEIAPAEATTLEAGMVGRTLHLLPVDLSTPEAQALALREMAAPEAEGRKLIAEALAGRRNLGRIILWDNRDEDGDVVRIASAGVTATVRLTHAPQTVIIPYDSGGTLIVIGVYDAGGGITPAIELATGPLPLPPLRVGEVRVLPLF